MLCIDGFDRILKRFDAWYRCDVADRPPVTIMHVWKPGGKSVPAKQHAWPRQAALDAEYHVEQFEAALDNWAWIGDTFPTFHASIAADETATLFGGHLEFNGVSSWAVHNLDNIRDVLTRQPNFTDPCWEAIRRGTDASLARSRGRWLTGYPASSYGGDTLVALRGPQNLCLDLMDDPEGVRLAMQHLSQFQAAVYHDLYDRIAARGEPVSVEGEVTFGRASRPGCDFLCMISPQMAREAIYPAIEQEIERLDRCYFHLDSAGALPHLDWLLAQKKLCGIQWVYGANRGPASRWIDVYQRIQAAGKAIELLPESPADALEVMRHLKPQGVWIKFFGGLSEPQARELISQVANRNNWAR